MTHAQTLIEAIESASRLTGKSPSTIGERMGQGGQFYKRLKAGKRVWPETAERAIERLEAWLDGEDTSAEPVDKPAPGKHTVDGAAA